VSPQSRKKAISKKATSKKASSKKTSAKKTSSKKLATGRRVPPAAKSIPSIPEAPREAPQPGTEEQKTRARRKT
jgi:ribonuclease E